MNNITLLLNRRAKEWPSVREVTSHALVSEQGAKIYVLEYEVGQSAERAQELASVTPAAESVEDAGNRGFLVLKPEEKCYVFLKDPASMAPCDDVLVAMTMDKDELGQADLARLNDLRGEINGQPAEDKIAYEHLDGRACHNGRGEHCYNLGLVYQKQKTMTMLASTMKKSIDTPIDLPKEVLSVGSKCAISGLSLKAPRLLKVMNGLAHAYNTPRIGCDENTCYPAMQLNVAKATEGAERADGIASLGIVGKPHYDGQDSPVGLTCMFNLSQDHPDVGDEVFTVLGLGLCFVIPPLSGVYFSGLYLHTGTQPMYSSPRKDEQHDYYRVTLICYPPKDILHNHGSLALGMGPDGDVAKHTSEVRSSWIPSANASDHTTFFQDGLGIMDRGSYIDFLVRCFHQQVEYQLHQANPKVNLTVDFASFVQSFSYKDDHGERVQVRPRHDTCLGERENIHVNGQRLLEARSQLVGPLRGARKKRRSAVPSPPTADVGVAQGDRRAKRKRTRDKEGRHEGDEGQGCGHRRRKKQRVREVSVDDESQEGEEEDEDPSDSPDERMVIDLAAFPCLAAFPKLNPTDIGIVLCNLESFNSTPPVELESSDPGTLPDFWGGGGDSLVAAFVGASKQYWNLQTAKGLVGAHCLMLNMLFWEMVEQEVCLSQSPEHPNHNLRGLVEDYLFGEGVNKAKLVVAWTDVNREADQPSQTSQYVCGRLQLKTEDKLGVTAWKTGDIDTNELMVRIIGTFWGMEIEDRLRATMTRSIVEQLGLEVLLVDSVASFLQCGLRYTMGVYKNPSLTFVREMARMRVVDSMADVQDLTENLAALKKAVLLKVPGFARLFSNLSREDSEPGYITCGGPSRPFLMRFELLKDEAVWETMRHHPKLYLMALIMELSLPFLRETEPSSSFFGHRMFLNMVKGNTDWYCVYRDRAKSRRRILADGGPFSDRNLTTASGFFSAMVFRGITMSTDFLMEHQTLFADLGEWKTVYAPFRPAGEVEENEDKPYKQWNIRVAVNPYVCNRKAYGTPTNRQPLFAKRYWMFAQECAEDTQLQQRGGYSALQFYNRIRNAELPAFGPLTTYLLVADYVKAGLVTPFTDEAFGIVLKKINTGGARGLGILGYNCGTAKAIEQAFTEVRLALAALFTEDEKMEMDFGGELVEHCLCKLFRMTTMDSFQQVCNIYGLSRV